MVILKSLPVFQCDRCSEYSVDDSTFRQAEEIVARANSSSELTIIPFRV